MTASHAYPAALDVIIAAIDGQSFEDFDQLEASMRELVIQHSDELPVGYTLSRALDDAIFIGAIDCDEDTGEYAVNAAPADQH